MKDESEKQTPDVIARQWLYAFERCARDRNYDEALSLLHKNCVYFGLAADSPTADWLAWWPHQLNYTVDMAATKFIPEGNLIMFSCAWLAKPVVIGAPDRVGNMSGALMRFANEKVLAVMVHISRRME
jgi:hypothetical protein